MLDVLRRRQGQHQKLLEPMFPRYLFIHLDEESENWSPIRSTRGVIRLVRFGLIPARVPDALIDQIRALEVDHTISVEALPKMGEGDAIKIVEGAFAGHEGIFQAHSGARRATILLKIADRYTRVQMSIDHIDVA